jgi:uncharacterized protein YqiB (DUF1249 family)
MASKKCGICKQDFPDCAMEVHHIDRNRKNNTLENRIVLCRTCHRSLHRLLPPKETYDQSLQVQTFGHSEDVEAGEISVDRKTLLTILVQVENALAEIRQLKTPATQTCMEMTR